MQQKVRLIKAVKTKYPHLSNRQIKDLVAHKRIRVADREASLPMWVNQDDSIAAQEDFLGTELEPNPHVRCQLIQESEHYYFLSKEAHVHSVAHRFQEK